MKLGDSVEITVGVEDVALSLAFYERLGFRRLEDAPRPAERVRLTDGAVVFALEGGHPRGGRRATWPTYLAADVAAVARDAAAAGIRATDRGEGALPWAAFADPGGHRLEVVQAPAPAGTAEGEGAVVGRFGEFSLEVDDVAATVAFWRRLGFAPTEYSPGDAAGWDSLSDGVLTVGVYGRGHCPHVFRSPAITYFNPDSDERIARIRQDGFTFAQELQPAPATRDAVLESPEGQMLFLFGY